MKRSRHDLPAGIQARKKIKAGVECTVYVVATKAAGDALQYSQFNAIEDAIAFKQNQDNA